MQFTGVDRMIIDAYASTPKKNHYFQTKLRQSDRFHTWSNNGAFPRETNMKIKRSKYIVSITATIILLWCMFGYVHAQIVTIGKSEVLYYGTQKNGSKAALYTKKSVYESPFGIPHDGTLNTNWQMVIDAPICPIRKDAATFSFYLSQGYGMDNYEGPLFDPFRKRMWGVYNQNIAKMNSRRVPGDGRTPQWYPTGTLINLAPSYVTNVDKLYKGPATAIPDVRWEKSFWIVGIYKVTAADAIALPNARAGDLLGITHVEMSATGQRSALYNYRYAIGLSYSKAADAGKRWTYFGEIIKQHAAQYDDVFVDTDNGGGQPGYEIHNISGGAFLVVNGYYYVYFDEFCDTVNNPPKKEFVVPRVAVARAKVTDVLSTLCNNDNVGKIPPDQWKKYRHNGWNEDAMTGLGDNVLPLPASEWPAYYYNAGTDRHVSWPAASFSTHNSAIHCNAFGKNLFLMTFYARIDSHSTGKLIENLLLYRSDDGLNWKRSGTLYSQSFPVPSNTAPYTGGFVQYSCFLARDPAASDDFHVVGKEFYVMYPHVKNGTPPFTKSRPFDADVYLTKITVRP
jgi:hypothetical protein